MLLIAVGGQAKNIGKTTLVCNIIAAFPQTGWTAVKFSTHAHEPAHSELILRSQKVAIWRQIRAGYDTDTARFLKAGAQRALFVQSEESNQPAASEILLKELSPATHVIVESTKMSELLNPDLFLMIVDSSAPRFKKSSTEKLHLVDAFVRRRAKGDAVTKTERISGGRQIFEARERELEPKLALMIAELLRPSR